MVGADEIAQFTEHGYLGPFELLPELTALAIGKRLADEVLPVRSPTYAHSPTDVPKLSFVRDRHLDSPLLARILGDERVVKRLTALLGPDVLLWRSDFFMQATGDRETLPHQDKNFSGMRNIPALEASEGGIARNITAWIAFTPMDRAQGGLYLVPGSHRDGVLPEVPAGVENSIFGKGGALARTFSDAERLDLTVRPGQFVLFTNLVVHGSYPIMHPDARRVAISARYVATDTLVNPLGTDVNGHGLELSRYGAMLVAGSAAGFRGVLRDAPGSGMGPLEHEVATTASAR
ncbi:MAG: phytanoyl-CoA dioxygenase family protein [Kofleriaceae bacterium]